MTPTNEQKPCQPLFDMIARPYNPIAHHILMSHPSIYDKYNFRTIQFPIPRIQWFKFPEKTMWTHPAMITATARLDKMRSQMV